MAEEEKKDKLSIFIVKLVVVVILIVLIIFFVKTDFFKNKIMTPILSPIMTSFKFMFGELTYTKKILSGEKDVFSLESETEIKEKTGIEISELKAFGLDSNNEFGVDADIVANKFDENIEEVNVFVSCNLISDEFSEIINGAITSTRVKDLDGKKGFVIKNYKGREKEDIPLRCVFPTDKRPVGEADVRFNLVYSFPSEGNLDVFVVHEDTFNEYEGKLDLAFKELGEGKYKDYKSKIDSKMKYISDVKVAMGFESQPLGVNRDYSLFFQFVNENNENKVDFNGFDIILPDGIKFDNCNYLEDEGFLEIINKQLNSEDRKSERFECSVNINEDVFGGSISDILKVYPPINAKLSYDNILKKEIKIK